MSSSGDQMVPPPVVPQAVPGLVPESKVSKGISIAGMVLGIVGVVFAFIPIIGSPVAIICGILALIFGVVGLVKKHGGLAIAALILGVAAIVVSIVVSSAAAKAVNDAVNGISTPGSVTSAADGSQPDATAPAAASPHFGDTYTWNSGVAVTISAPQPFTPSASSFGQVAGYTNLEFSVTLTNNSSSSVNAMLMSTSVLSGGKEGPSIFDSSQNIGPVTTDVPAGKSLQWDIAYSVADPNDITMSVSSPADLLADKVTFTN